jgi:peptidoglycan/xylan/chitin deacetylase (PgdA/CDA1 family)
MHLLLRLFFSTALGAGLMGCGTEQPPNLQTHPGDAFPLPQGTPPPVQTPLSPGAGNFIPQPGAENGTQTPQDWEPDSWSEVQALLQWRQGDAFSGRYYLSTELAQEPLEGDAKWVFPAQTLPSGWYEYSDYYRADGRNRLTWFCEQADGRRHYYNADQSHRSPIWQQVAFRFYVPPDCKVGVFHLLDRKGYLHTDHHVLRAVSPAPLPRPQISITFDDIWLTAADWGAKELEKRNWRGSFYVTARFAQRPEAIYASPTHLQRLVQAGHEIGSHSSTHPLLSSLNSSEIIHELHNSQKYLQDVGLGEVQGLAYPFGDFSEAVETESFRFYKYVRTSLAGLNDHQTNPYRLKILAITRDTTDAELTQWIDQAIATSTWLILLFHDLNDIPTDFTYTTSASQYLRVLDQLQQKQVAVVTVAEGLKALQP